jgi:hypothetical protein
MGRFIEITALKDHQASEWVIPRNLLVFDQREPRWPNDLFPYEHTINDFFLQDGKIKVVIRRFCERSCQGDVAVENIYTNNGYRSSWRFWFELDTDQKMFYDAWQNLIPESI